MKGTSDAKEYAVSFYVKGNASATYVVELFDIDNSRRVSKTFSVTTSWTRVELTFPADTTGAFDDDNALSLNLHLWLVSGTTYTGGTLSQTWIAHSDNDGRATGGGNFFSSTDNTFFITGMQLEVGSVATEFEHRSFGEELALCQRYFQKSYNQSVALGTATNVGITVGVRGNGAFTMTAHLKETMRATPTTVAYSPVSGTSGKVRDLEGGDDESATITASESTIHFTGTGSNVSNAYSVHYTADAEL
jgi:hypothetical protein